MTDPEKQSNGEVVKATESEKGFSDDEVPESHKCGYGPCKPDCVQTRCNKPQILLCAIGFLTFAQTYVINGIVNVNISTIERRYKLSSSEVVWIPATYDITAGIVAVISGYLAMSMHNGLLLTFSALSLGLGSLVMTLPHWIGDLYAAGQTPSRVCEIGGNGTDCSEDDARYLGFFLFAQVLHGIGGGILWVVAIPYMDSNIRVENASLYVGIMYITSSLGPACGYIFGGLMLSIYVDTGRVDGEDVEVEIGDPQWVGAWWLGYIISFALMLCAALILLTFPRELPSGLRYKKDRKSQAHRGAGEDVTRKKDVGKSWSDLCYSLKIVLLNPIFLANTIAGIASTGLITAFGVFLPKLMEAQFSLSAGLAAAASGVVLLPGACFGLFIGGCIPKVRQSLPRGLMAQCLFASVCGIFLAFIYLIHCQSPAIAGVNVPYFAPDSDASLDSAEIYHPCNMPCNCTTAAYDPICGAHDQVQYFSPCLAGCQVIRDTVFGEGYEDCSCVNMTLADPVNPNSTDWVCPNAWRGFCESDCTTEFVVFLTLLLVQQLITFIGIPSGAAVTLRTVPDTERSFATGLNSALIRYLGNVPAPLIFGAIFDASCLLWQESCGTTGSCWVYDSNSLAWGMTWSVVVVCAICSACYIFGIIVYRPPEEDIDVMYMNWEEKLSDEEQRCLEERAAQSARGSVASVDRTVLSKDFGNTDPVDKVAINDTSETTAM